MPGWPAMVMVLAGILGGQAAPARQADRSEGEKPAADQPTDLLAGSAVLDVDADAQSLLHQARQYLEDRKYREALLLLQHVAEKYGQTMSHDAGPVYRPAYRCVERILLGLPPEAMRLYRLSADSQARALLGGPVHRCRDAARLKTVYQRYFASSLGDEAGFAYACLMLDRGKPALAAGVLAHLLEHPDLTVARSEIWLRLAVARWAAGDRSGAAEAWRVFERTGRAGADRRAGLVESLLAGGAAEPEADVPAGPAAMAMLNQGPALAWGGRSAVPAGCSVRWSGRYPLKVPDRQQVRYAVQTRQPQYRAEMVRRWLAGRWFPTDRPVVGAGCVFVVVHDRLLAFEQDSGRLVWTAEAVRNGPATRSSSRSTYSMSSLPAEPSTMEEVRLFTEVLSRSVAVHDGLVYFIDDREARRPTPPWIVGRSFAWSGDGGGNTLVMVDARTGRPVGQWGRHAKGLAGARFLNVPAAGRDYLAVPMARGGQLYLAVFARADRRLVGQPIFLGTLDQVQQSGTTTVAVAVHRGRAYVCPGSGVVFCVDLEAGQVEWATVYRRQIRQADRRATHPFMTGRAPGYAGWKDNALLVWGTRLLVFPSDACSILAVDCMTGRPVGGREGGAWVELEDGRPLWPLGVVEDRLVVSLLDECRAYDLGGGGLLWRAPVSRMTGRAVLAGSVLYVPADRQLFRLDGRTGKRLAVVPVGGEQGPADPLGNLVSDGRALVVAGLGRVYRLEENRALFDRLEARIGGQRPAAALLERAAFYRRQGRLEQAAADLRLAVEKAGTLSNRIRARHRLFDLLLDLAEQQPTQAQAVLAEAAELVSQPHQQVRWELARAGFLRAQGRLTEAAPLYLKVRQTGRAVELERVDEHGRCTMTADLAAAAALEQLCRRYPQQMQRLIETAAGQALEHARALDEQAEREAAMWQVARAYPTSEAAGRAVLLACGLVGEPNRSAGSGLDFEIAEMLLRQWSEQEQEQVSPVLRAASRLALGRMYGRRLWKSAARGVLDPVWRTMGQVVLWQETDGTVVRAGKLAERLLQGLAGSGEPAGRSVQRRAGGEDEPGLPPPPWKLLWQRRGGGMNIVGTGWPAGDVLAGRYLLVISPSQLMCLQVDDGKLVWQMGLGSSRSGVYYYRNRDYRLDRQEHLFVALAGDRLGAFSLLTGKTLWSQPSGGQSPARMSGRTMVVGGSVVRPDPSLWADQPDSLVLGRGRVARLVVDDQQMTMQLNVYDAATGRRLWSRRGDWALNGLLMHGRFLLAFQDQGQEVLMFDASSGRAVGQVRLAGRNTNWPVVPTEAGLGYYDGRAVKMVGLPDGQVLWQVEQANLALMRRLDERTVALVGPDRKVRLVDLEAGRVRASIRLNHDGSQLFDVAQDRAGRLFCLGLSKQGQDVLGVVEVPGGRLVRRVVLGKPGFRLPAELLARCGPVIPWVQRQTQPNRSTTMQYVFYRLEDGKQDPAMKLPVAGLENQFRYFMYGPQLVAGRLVVPTISGLYAFGTDRQGRSDRSGQEGQKGTGR